ncbi:MAG: peptidylprolyl isomerase [candidate division KSB1 bacterium]|nr:peptidylprolyl isomerase [candidate division KSB1 bacterium]
MNGRKIASIGVVLLLVVGGCKKSPGAKGIGTARPCETLTQEEIQQIIARVNAAPLEPVQPNERVVVETDFGRMVIQLFTEKAPLHTQYFKRLAKTGFYDCTLFHRVQKDFVIQGGDILSRDADVTNDGTGSAGYRIPAEFNDIPHEKGTVSMARGRDPNSAGTQFFICLKRLPFLDRQYTAFGKVIEGLDVLDKIAAVETTQQPRMQEKSRPTKPVYIRRVYMITQ